MLIKQQKTNVETKMDIWKEYKDDNISVLTSTGGVSQTVVVRMYPYNFKISEVCSERLEHLIMCER